MPDYPVNCSIIDRKSAFRRCTGCRSFYYCSRICQAIYWRLGGHRDTCRSYGTVFLIRNLHARYPREKNDYLYSSARQRSFLRALVHHDYQKAQLTVLSQQTWFMKAHPGEEFLTLYNYTTRPVEIEIHPLSVVDVAEAFTGVEWRSIVSRAAASRGRMGIHVVVISEPAGNRQSVIPLRSNMSMVYDGLQRLATEFKARRIRGRAVGTWTWT
ncbi:hypothetical protein C8R45DRAFT_1083567 [Mycena sanguinolenta]|nr:hypothetical protein C8R45DRAFT_1083567 [Mycena sanguinolenta]